MHICIVGTGASGWLTAHKLSKNEKVTKITIVGSDKIPPVGVGESTTMNFITFIKDVFGFNFNTPTEEYYNFLVDIDATIKSGVYYRGWAHKDFMHTFITNIEDHGPNYFLLGNKPMGESVDDYLMPTVHHSLHNRIQCLTISHDYYNNNLPQNAIHFDANKFISTMQTMANSNEKMNHIIGTAIDLIYEGEIAKTLILDDGRKIDADYFVSCIGQTAFNQKVFREEYVSYSDVLLTNKAVVYPLEYIDKPKQFHPYTVAKTLKYGWRWITPTYSRIGTGYVFSDDYISTDEAIYELKKDIGRQDIEPFVVDFYPRQAKNPYKKNTCTIGMAAGFLEPLDAPGLSITISSVYNLERIFDNKLTIEDCNKISDRMFKKWASFILCQYKTSKRNDTSFWEDHRNIKYEPLDEFLNIIYNNLMSFDDLKIYARKNLHELSMYFNTIAGKDIKWKTGTTQLPKKVDPFSIKTIDHYKFIEGLHQIYGKQ